MSRRRFLMFAGAAAAVSVVRPRVVRAQHAGKVYRIGVFVGAANPVMASGYRAFLDELRTLGFIEGQNLVVDQRETAQTPAALAAGAVEMGRAKVDVIFVGGTLQALQAAAGTGLPIVVHANNFDPIEHGYAKSLSNPGGNVTGVVSRNIELAEKQVELLTQAFPDRKRLAMQWDSISAEQFGAAERRAKAFGLEVISLGFEKPPYDFTAAFRRMKEDDVQMVLCLTSPYFATQAGRIVELAIEGRLPAMFIFRRYAELGGLMSYGVDNLATFRQIAGHVAKILRGAKPADLPVEQPNTFELVVNLKTAKAIGVELPTSILLRANTVIE